jgi:hypothetical protein
MVGAGVVFCDCDKEEKMDIFDIYNVIYRVIYIYVVGMCVWSIFTHKPFQRQIGYALVMVPFLLKILGIR